MTVKYDASRLKIEADGFYSDSWIVSNAKDIVRITYARKVLYEAEEVEQA